MVKSFGRKVCPKNGCHHTQQQYNPAGIFQMDKPIYRCNKFFDRGLFSRHIVNFSGSKLAKPLGMGKKNQYFRQVAKTTKKCHIEHPSAFFC